jgi:hypothetical protein
LTAIVKKRFLGNHVPLFLWRRFSGDIRRHITVALPEETKALAMVSVKALLILIN